MKPSLRNIYFGWLLLLTLILYLLIFAAYFVIELRESHVMKTPFTKEYPELLAIAGVMMLTVPATVIVAWNIAGRLLQPLNKVLVTAQRIQQGNLDERIPPLPDNDELSVLADTINDAFDRYASTVRRFEHFSADASHQLRTPMAAIKTAAEVSLQRNRTVEDYQDTLSDILEQTEKLNRTIEQLLLLSRIDDSIKQTFTPINLTSNMREWIQESVDLFNDQNMRLELDADDKPIIINGNEVLLREVYFNLLNNALEVLSREGKVLISIRRNDQHTFIWRVEDSGPGISLEERDRVFDRFYRGKRTTHVGSGLGLAIVREIVQIHDASISIGQSQSLGGASFTMILPLKT